MLIAQYVLALLFLSALATSDPPFPSSEKQTAPEQKHSAQSNNQSGTQIPIPQPPPISIIVAPTVTAQSTTPPQPENGNKSASWDRTFEIISILVTAFATVGIFFFTRRLSISTIALQKEATESGKTAARAAQALASVSSAMTENVGFLKTSLEINREIADTQKEVTRMQLRAYVSVEIGKGGDFQDRANNIKFFVVSCIHNRGQTPATKVRHSLQSGILDRPLPINYVLPKMFLEGEESMLPPHQPRDIAGKTLDFVDDSEVESIMNGNGTKALYVWGQVVYEDAFKDTHTTTFCYMLIWMNRAPYAVWIPGRNTAT